MQASNPLDYKTSELFIHGLKVTSTTMVGLLAEQVPKIARDKRIGMAGLLDSDLPTYLCVSLDGVQGVRKVCCFDEDRCLALQVAKTMRPKLWSVGLEMVESCMPVRSEGGRKIGEHDMLCEVVSNGQAEPPMSIRGYVSVELKLRRLWADAERQRRRKQLQADCEGQGDPESSSNCAWWPREQHHYAGRLLLMVVFTERTGNMFKVCADIKLAGEGHWRPLFGWPGSRLSLAPPQPQPQRRVTCAAPKAQPKPKAQAKATAVPARGMTSALVNQLVFRSGVAEVKSLLQKANKNPSKASYWVNVAKEKHHWGEEDLHKTPRALETSARGNKRQRVGGVPEWVATKRVLVQMCKDWFGA
mgnify:CR=1 FL=1